MVKYYSHVISSRQLLLIKSNQATKLRKTALDKSLERCKGESHFTPLRWLILTNYV